MYISFFVAYPMCLAISALQFSGFLSYFSHQWSMETSDIITISNNLHSKSDLNHSNSINHGNSIIYLMVHLLNLHIYRVSQGA